MRFGQYRDQQQNPRQRVWHLTIGFLLVLTGSLLIWANLQLKLLAAGNGLLTLVFSTFVMILLLGGAYLFLQAWQAQKATLKKVRLNRQRVRLTPQGMTLTVMMLVFLIASMLSHSNMMVLMFSFIAGAIVVNGTLGMTMVRNASVKRRVPAGVMAGEKIAVNIEYTNKSRFRSAWVMVVRDTINHQTESLQAEVLIARIMPQKTASAYYDFRPMRRGIYRFGPLEVLTSSPLGMVERGHIFDLEDKLAVYPRTGKLTSIWKKERSHAAELVQQKQTRKGVFDDEYHSMREYRPGDNPRAIHWRTSARRNEVIVREFHQSRDDDVLLMVDLWLPKNPTEHHLELTETAVSFAATVSLEQMQKSRDFQFTLLINGSTMSSWSGRSSPMATEEALNALALAEGGRECELSDWMEEACQYRSPSTSLILATSRPESELQTLHLLLEAALEEPLLNVTIVSVDSKKFSNFFLLPDFD
ncbi:hypothetical protein Pla110_30380 [Polystyrenella longa]|uniref:DUF58 domain-containing protein n=1 Tax=Polystyrenella longa TaxID=2528007 RepID=A0A518CPZ8_9PLAN|nr:DUF58 domain-containing protein [Polystyrenella longa]QDU81297.1 hypothetical protein Pla110_30380 [Polystyrenella longa]